MRAATDSAPTGSLTSPGNWSKPRSISFCAVGIRRHLIPAGHTTVAVVDDLVVGLLAVSTGTDCSRIDQLYLLPAWVGRGIGTRLLELARRELVAPW